MNSELSFQLTALPTVTDWHLTQLKKKKDNV